MKRWFVAKVSTSKRDRTPPTTKKKGNHNVQTTDLGLSLLSHFCPPIPHSSLDLHPSTNSGTCPIGSFSHVCQAGTGHCRLRQLWWRVSSPPCQSFDSDMDRSHCCDVFSCPFKFIHSCKYHQRHANLERSGLEADQRVLAAHGCYALTATTGLTAQNTLGVQDIFVVPSEFVRKQINAGLEDVGADVVKLG